MHDISLLNYSLIFAGLVCLLGLVGYVGRRALRVKLISAGIMLLGTALTFLSWGTFHGNSGGIFGTGVVVIIFLLETVVGKTLLQRSRTVHGSDDVAHWQPPEEPKRHPDFIPTGIPVVSSGKDVP